MPQEGSKPRRRGNMSEDTELDGMAAVAQGVAEQRWPHTMDAEVWVKEWMKTIREFPPGYEKDEGFMLCWFANAIMAGYDTAMSRKESMVPRAWWERLRAGLEREHQLVCEDRKYCQDPLAMLKVMQEIEKEAEG